MLGQDVTASVTAEVSAASGANRRTFRRTAGVGRRRYRPGDVPSGVVSARADDLRGGSSVRWTGLPFGGTLRSVSAATCRHRRVRLSGANVVTTAVTQGRAPAWLNACPASASPAASASATVAPGSRTASTPAANASPAPVLSITRTVAPRHRVPPGRRRTRPRPAPALHDHRLVRGPQRLRQRRASGAWAPASTIASSRFAKSSASGPDRGTSGGRSGAETQPAGRRTPRRRRRSARGHAAPAVSASTTGRAPSLNNA